MVKVITKDEEQPLIDEIRNKSFEQILKEAATLPLEEEPEEETKPIEPTEEEKAAKEAKEKLEAEEADKKRLEEISAKTAQDIIDKQKAEEQLKLDKAKDEEDEKKRQEDLKPKYTGKDAEGNTVPLSYEELNNESVRIAEERALTRMRAELAERDAKVKAEQDATAQTTAQQEANKKLFEEQLQTELNSDLADLYADNKLPKIVNKDDPNDTGNKEFKNLFETAQKVNGERIQKGLPAIRSIKLIYYEHYKPLGKPAGHDAPVLGSESTLSNELPEDRYVVSRDRHRPIEQIIKEETKRLARSLNIRGN